MGREEILQHLIAGIVSVLNESEHYDKQVGWLMDEICYSKRYHHIRRALAELEITLEPLNKIEVTRSMIRDEVYVYDKDDQLMFPISDKGVNGMSNSDLLDYVYREYWDVVCDHYGR